jgi:hypothetical protein
MSIEYFIKSRITASLHSARDIKISFMGNADRYIKIITFNNFYQENEIFNLNVGSLLVFVNTKLRVLMQINH